MIRRIATLTALGLALAGCAHQDWRAGPTVNNTVTQEQVAAQCRIGARHGGSGFVAAGAPGFVAGAALGNAVGNAAVAVQDFDDCMLANGYLIAPPKG